jgi:hypothetical protein
MRKTSVISSRSSGRSTGYLARFSFYFSSLTRYLLSQLALDLGHMRPHHPEHFPKNHRQWQSIRSLDLVPVQLVSGQQRTRRPAATRRTLGCLPGPGVPLAPNPLLNSFHFPFRRPTATPVGAALTVPLTLTLRPAAGVLSIFHAWIGPEQTTTAPAATLAGHGLLLGGILAHLWGDALPGVTRGINSREQRGDQLR